MKKIFCLITIGCVFLLSACVIKPIPITDQARRLRLENDLQDLFKGQEEIKGPITLYEAIARTLKYNMEYRVKIMEEAVERGSLTISKIDILPALTANAGYSHRSEYAGGTSMSLLDGTQSLVASASSERNLWTTSAGLSWNVLDFGVSFVRAKQQADRIMIANELRRKVIQNIVLDVTNAYWRAVAAQRVKKDFDEALKTTQAALERSEELEKRLLLPPLKALQDQQTLLDLNQKLLKFRSEMNSAIFQLAALMNLNPGTDFEVFVPDDEPLPTVPEGELALFEEAALLNRSEVREGDYKKRINRLEVRKAILQMFPGINLNITRNHTSNKFTFFTYWNELTLPITYNVLSLLSGPANIKFAKTSEKLEDARRMSISMAVLTQVHLSLKDYEDALQNYKLAKRQENVKERIRKQVAAARKAETTNELQSVLSKTKKLSAVMRSGLTYAGLQGASARIYHTIGVDRVPDSVEGYDIPTLAEAVKASMEKEWVFQGKQLDRDVSKAKTEHQPANVLIDEIKPTEVSTRVLELEKAHAEVVSEADGPTKPEIESTEVSYRLSVLEKAYAVVGNEAGESAKSEIESETSTQATQATQEDNSLLSCLLRYFRNPEPKEPKQTTASASASTPEEASSEGNLYAQQISGQNNTSIDPLSNKPVSKVNTEHQLANVLIDEIKSTEVSSRVLELEKAYEGVGSEVGEFTKPEMESEQETQTTQEDNSLLSSMLKFFRNPGPKTKPKPKQTTASAPALAPEEASSEGNLYAQQISGQNNTSIDLLSSKPVSILEHIMKLTRNY